ncbi:8793_t:CDS:2, partial [Paraglomus brasilianum]
DLPTTSLTFETRKSRGKPRGKLRGKQPRAKIVDYVPANEILPLPVSVSTVDGAPNNYLVKSSLYSTGYKNYGKFTTKLTCEDGVSVKSINPKFGKNESDSLRSDFKLVVPSNKKIVTCIRHVAEGDTSMIISFSFNPVHDSD